LGLKKAQGALVSEVSKGGPAEKGGVEVGDVIIRFDGKKVDEMRDLPRIVAETDIDKRVDVDIMRGGKEKKLFIVTGRLDETPVLAKDDEKPSSGAQKGPEVMGMALRDLDDAARSRYNIPGDVTGALIVSITPNSNAAEAGVRPGDVVTKIGQTTVTSVSEGTKALEAAQKSGQSSVLLLLRNSSGLRFIALKLGADKE